MLKTPDEYGAETGRGERMHSFMVVRLKNSARLFEYFLAMVVDNGMLNVTTGRRVS